MVEQVDWLLFKLLILGGLADNYGNIWKRVSKQICVIECTLTKLDIKDNAWMHKQKLSKDSLPSSYAFMSYLPYTLCASPNEVRSAYKSGIAIYIKLAILIVIYRKQSTGFNGRKCFQRRECSTCLSVLKAKNCWI